MTKYHIFHATKPDKMYKPIVDQPRTLVGTVLAKSLKGALLAAQNNGNQWCSHTYIRSTGTGDVIQEDQGYFYMLVTEGTGFQKI